MSMETLREEILKDAGGQAAAILAPARRESAKIIADAKKQAEAMRLSRQEEMKKAVELLRRQDAGKVQLQKKKIIMETRKKCVDAAFSDALEELQSMDAGKRSAMISSLVRLAEKQIPVAEIMCRKEDASLAKKYPLVIAEISGGIIAENRDKTLIVDLSYGSLFEGLREKELQRVNIILFGEK